MSALPADLAHGVPAVVQEAARSGLLEAALSRAATAAEHAVALSLSPRAVELMLDVLAALGILRQEVDGRYGVADGPAAFPWAHLVEFLRTGRALPLIDGGDGPRGVAYAEVVDWLSERFASAAAALAELLGPARTILDVGAGAGIWSLTMARARGAEVVIGLDLPPVVPRFVERARMMGLADRARTIAGSYFEVAPDAQVDRVVLANVLHLESDERVALLLRRAASWIVPDGEVVIIECLGGPGFESNLCRALYAAHLGLRTEQGGVRDAARLHRMCADAGLPHAGTVLLGARNPGLGAVVARREERGDGE